MSNFTKPTSPALQSGNALATGLLRCRPWIEGSGSSVADYSGNAANLTTRQSGTTTALTWGSDATYGAYVSFNGTNQDAIAVDTGLPTGTAARSRFVLVKAAATSLNYYEGYGTTGTALLAMGFQDVSGNYRYNLTTNAGSFAETSVANDGNFHSVGYTYNGTTFIFYVDGVACTPTSTLTVATALSGSEYFGQAGGTGGSGPGGSQGLWCPASIAGDMMWNVALTPTLVTQLQGQFWAVITPPPTLVVVPTSATVALNGTHSITPTLTNSSAALTASALYGSVPGSVTSGSPFTYTAPSSGTTDTVTVTDSTDSLTATCSITLTSTPTLTVSPTSATVALSGTQSITATLVNSSAALTAAALHGTVPGSVTSGVAFTYTAPSSGTTDTVTVTDSTDSLTAPCSITLVPVATTIAFMSFVPVGIFPAGQATNITVTPQVFNGTALVTPGTATVGAVLEVTVSSVGIGAYWCMITYHTTDLTIPNVPSVIWTYAGQSFVDAGPAGLVQLNLSQPVATGAPSQTVGGGLNAALAGAAGAINWASTVYTVSNTDSTVFRTFTTNVAAPTGGLVPTTRV